MVRGGAASRHAGGKLLGAGGGGFLLLVALPGAIGRSAKPWGGPASCRSGSPVTAAGMSSSRTKRDPGRSESSFVLTPGRFPSIALQKKLSRLLARKLMPGSGTEASPETLVRLRALSRRRVFRVGLPSIRVIPIVGLSDESLYLIPLHSNEANMPTTMLRKVLPKRLKAFIKEAIRREVETHLTLIPRDSGIDLETIRRDVETGLRDRGYVEAIWPHQPGSRCYMIPKTPEKTPEKCLHHESSSLPIPPKDLWLGYGQTVEQFLALGEENIRAMRDARAERGPDRVGGTNPGLRLRDRADDSLASRSE